jgi:hypothetical protein
MIRRLFRHQRPGPRRWVAAATAALVLTAAGLAIATPAHALPLPINDGFEDNPLSRWTTAEVPGLTDAIVGENARNARTGTNMALLIAYPDAPAAATIFRTISPDTTPSSIRATAWIRRWAYNGENDDDVTVFLRVRSGGPTGRIISVFNLGISGSTSWRFFTFNTARPTGAFTVEIGAYHGTVAVDDIQISAV